MKHSGVLPGGAAGNATAGLRTQHGLKTQPLRAMRAQFPTKASQPVSSGLVRHRTRPKIHLSASLSAGLCNKQFPVVWDQRCACVQKQEQEQGPENPQTRTRGPLEGVVFVLRSKNSTNTPQALAKFWALSDKFAEVALGRGGVDTGGLPLCLWCAR